MELTDAYTGKPVTCNGQQGIITQVDPDKNKVRVSYKNGVKEWVSLRWVEGIKR